MGRISKAVTVALAALVCVVWALVAALAQPAFDVLVIEGGAYATVEPADVVREGGAGNLSDDTPLVESGAGSPGTGTTASRDDHVHPAAGGGSSVPLSDAKPKVESGSGAAGSSDDASRGDHVHPARALPLSDLTPKPTGTAAPGVRTDVSRADHVHASAGGGGTVPEGAVQIGTDLTMSDGASSISPTYATYCGKFTAGNIYALRWVKQSGSMDTQWWIQFRASDPLEVAWPNARNGYVLQWTASGSTCNVFRPANSNAGAFTVQFYSIASGGGGGGGSGPALADTKPKVESGSGAPGTLETASRGDHVHPARTLPAIPQAGTATPIVETGTGAPGSSARYSRQDHVHPARTLPPVPQPGTASPLEDGTAAAGSSALYSRQDHVHPLPETKAPAAHTLIWESNPSTVPQVDFNNPTRLPEAVCDQLNEPHLFMIESDPTLGGNQTEKAVYFKGGARTTTWSNFVRRIPRYRLIPDGEGGMRRVFHFWDLQNAGNRTNDIRHTEDFDKFLNRPTLSERTPHITNGLWNAFNVFELVVAPNHGCLLSITRTDSRALYRSPVEGKSSTQIYRVDTASSDHAAILTQIGTGQGTTMPAAVCTEVQKPRIYLLDVTATKSGRAYSTTLLFVGRKQAIGTYGTFPINSSTVFGNIANLQIYLFAGVNITDDDLGNTRCDIKMEAGGVLASPESLVWTISRLDDPDAENPATAPALSNANPQNTGAQPDPGTSSSASRADHVHQFSAYPYESMLPRQAGVAWAGERAAMSRGDHVHPSELPKTASHDALRTLRVNAGGTAFELGSVMPSPSVLLPKADGTAIAGTSRAYSRADHVHPLPPNELPSLTGNAKQVLSVKSDASTTEWISPTTVILEGAGIGATQADQVIASNDAGNGIVTHTFGTVVKNGLPAITGHAGQALVVNPTQTGIKWLAPDAFVGAGMPATDRDPGNFLVSGPRPTLAWKTPAAAVLSGLPAITGHGGNCLKANAAATGLEFNACTGSHVNASIPNPTVAGKLKHLRVNAAGAAYELADPPIGVPAPANAETGQVLTRNNSGNAQWLDNAGAPFGTGWVKLFEGSQNNIAGSTALDINLTSTTTEAEGFLEAQRDTAGSGPYRQFLWQMAWNIGEGSAEELVQVQAMLPGVPLGGSVAQANQPVAYWGAMSSLNSLCNVALKASRTVVNFSTSSCRPDWGNRGSAGNVSLFWKLWGKR